MAIAISAPDCRRKYNQEMRFRMNPYYEQMILNAEPVELIGLLYQRAISSVREAREHLAQKRIAERSKAITRAYAAVEQLIVALRPEAAPELCVRLRGLYVYTQQRLLDANMQQADAPLAEALGLLTTLAEGWSGVSEQLNPRDLEASQPKTGPWARAGQALDSGSSSGVRA
jgi:flagellar secretion chaperone FliS